MSHSKISYAHSDEVFRDYKRHLVSLIRNLRPSRIADIGGGASPALLPDDSSSLGIREYTLIDISAAELAKSSDAYSKVQCDVCGPSVPKGYDLVISHFLAEHIANPEAFHRNVFEMLNPEGVAFHCFPTMFSLPYCANLIISESFGRRLVTWADPARKQDGKQGKFPAFYRWCSGPTAKSIRRFQSLGFAVESYCGFFGHYYYSKIPPLHWLHNRKTDFLLRHPIPQFTNVATVVLRKSTAFQSQIHS